MSHNEATELMSALAAHFAPEQLHFKPACVKGNRALALPYVDARAIQDRLDEVLGVAGWMDEYEPLPDGSGVVCKLRCLLGDTWITKTDVGGPSEQPDGGDRLKAAFSDALKRAAVKFGVGRYLYRLPSQWCDYDPTKKRFVRTPTLPQEATGGGKAGSRPSKAAVRTLEADSGPATATITDEERDQLSQLLHRKGKSVAAALKSARCRGAELADLSREQFAGLVERLAKLPDKMANGSA
jgi:hypothetical protein